MHTKIGQQPNCLAVHAVYFLSILNIKTVKDVIIVVSAEQSFKVGTCMLHVLHVIYPYFPPHVFFNLWPCYQSIDQLNQLCVVVIHGHDQYDER